MLLCSAERKQGDLRVLCVRAYTNFEFGTVTIESYHELNSYNLVFPKT